ncbi:hypothetical protein AB0D65_12625 [Streptomyces griseoloalbus]|uniref:Uncharacterized protein n=1 Tax=Streptomyces griseoloalbus TaxID=67303 RepID=A0ABV3E3U8_9ACTN
MAWLRPVRRRRNPGRPGGLVAAHVWDCAEGMGFRRRFWDAAIEVDPAAAALDEGRRGSLALTARAWAVRGRRTNRPVW